MVEEEEEEELKEDGGGVEMACVGWVDREPEVVNGVRSRISGKETRTLFLPA